MSTRYRSNTISIRLVDSFRERKDVHKIQIKYDINSFGRLVQGKKGCPQDIDQIRYQFVWQTRLGKERMSTRYRSNTISIRLVDSFRERKDVHKIQIKYDINSFGRLVQGKKGCPQDIDQIRYQFVWQTRLGKERMSTRYRSNTISIRLVDSFRERKDVHKIQIKYDINSFGRLSFPRENERMSTRYRSNTISIRLVDSFRERKDVHKIQIKYDINSFGRSRLGKERMSTRYRSNTISIRLVDSFRERKDVHKIQIKYDINSFGRLVQGKKGCPQDIDQIRYQFVWQTRLGKERMSTRYRSNTISIRLVDSFRERKDVHKIQIKYDINSFGRLVQGKKGCPQDIDLKYDINSFGRLVQGKKGCPQDIDQIRYQFVWQTRLGKERDVHKIQIKYDINSFGRLVQGKKGCPQDIDQIRYQFVWQTRLGKERMSTRYRSNTISIRLVDSFRERKDVHKIQIKYDINSFGRLVQGKKGCPQDIDQIRYQFVWQTRLGKERMSTIDIFDQIRYQFVWQTRLGN